MLPRSTTSSRWDGRVLRGSQLLSHDDRAARLRRKSPRSFWRPVRLWRGPVQSPVEVHQVQVPGIARCFVCKLKRHASRQHTRTRARAIHDTAAQPEHYVVPVANAGAAVTRTACRAWCPTRHAWRAGTIAGAAHAARPRTDTAHAVTRRRSTCTRPRMQTTRYTGLARAPCQPLPTLPCLCRPPTHPATLTPSLPAQSFRPRFSLILLPRPTPDRCVPRSWAGSRLARDRGAPLAGYALVDGDEERLRLSGRLDSQDERAGLGGRLAG